MIGGSDYNEEPLNLISVADRDLETCTCRVILSFPVTEFQNPHLNTVAVTVPVCTQFPSVSILGLFDAKDMADQWYLAIQCTFL